MAKRGRWRRVGVRAKRARAMAKRDRKRGVIESEA
jgi:hypothetical protein